MFGATEFSQTKIKDIPETTRSISLNMSDICSHEQTNINNIFKYIPKWVKNITLYLNYPKDTTADALAQIFAAIPDSVVSIRLNMHDLQYPIEKLRILLPTIPKRVTELCLATDNILHSGEERNDNILSLIPNWVTKIELSETRGVSAIYLPRMIPYLPETITHFRLYMNPFIINPNASQILQYLMHIPKGVTNLDLSQNRFNRLTSDELSTVFGNIPNWITHLHLSVNRFGEQTGEQLAQVFAAIPHGVIHLDLSVNGFGKNNPLKLAQVFAAIPTSVTHIDLSTNFLGDNNPLKLAQVFAAIPPSVTHIDLGNNNLGLYPPSYLAQVCAAIPPTVKHVELTDNRIFYNKTIAERDALLSTLWPRIGNSNSHMRLQLDGNGESTFRRAVLPLLSALKQGKLNYNVVQLTLEFLLPKDTNAYNVINKIKSISQVNRPVINRTNALKDLSFIEPVDSLSSAGRRESNCQHVLDVFYNVALFILGLGIFYIAACIYNQGFFHLSQNNLALNNLDLVDSSHIISSPHI